jgi:hypothetical protein
MYDIETLNASFPTLSLLAQFNPSDIHNRHGEFILFSEFLILGADKKAQFGPRDWEANTAAFGPIRPLQPFPESLTVPIRRKYK